MADYTGQVRSKSALTFRFMFIFGLIFAISGGSFAIIGVGVGIWGDGADAFGLMLGFAGLGSIFFIVGMIFVLRHLSFVRRLIRIRDGGERLEAEVVTHEESSVEINNIRQYRLIWKTPDGARGQSGLHPLSELMIYSPGNIVTVYRERTPQGEMVWEGDCGLSDRTGPAAAPPRQVQSPEEQPAYKPTVRRG
ncbi:hypothetical protein [Halovulum sp. GXIMD14793]